MEPQETILFLDQLLNGLTLPVLTTAAQILGWAADFGARGLETGADKAILALAVHRSDVTWVNDPEEAKQICALLKDQGVRAPMQVRLEGRTCILTPGDQRTVVADLLTKYYEQQETFEREHARQDTGRSRVVTLDQLRRYGGENLCKVTVQDRDGDCTGVLLSQRLSRAGIPHCVRTGDPEHSTLLFAARDARAVCGIRDRTLLEQVTDKGPLLRRETRWRCEVRQELETSLLTGRLPDRAGGGRIRVIVLGDRAGRVLALSGHHLSVSDSEGTTRTFREGTQAWEKAISQVLGSCDCVAQLTPEQGEHFWEKTQEERETMLLSREREERTFADAGRPEPDERDLEGLRRAEGQLEDLVRRLAARGVAVQTEGAAPANAQAFELGLTLSEYQRTLDLGPLPGDPKEIPDEVLDRLERELGEPERYDPTLDLDLEQLWREVARETDNAWDLEDRGREDAEFREEREV